MLSVKLVRALGVAWVSVHREPNEIARYWVAAVVAAQIHGRCGAALPQHAGSYPPVPRTLARAAVVRSRLSRCTRVCSPPSSLAPTGTRRAHHANASALR